MGILCKSVPWFIPDYFNICLVCGIFLSYNNIEQVFNSYIIIDYSIWSLKGLIE